MVRQRGLTGVVLALALAGCAGGENDPSPVSPSPADFSGRWAFQIQATSTTCPGLVVSAEAEQGYLVVAQTDATLAVEHLDGCGGLVYAAPGSVSGSTATIIQDVRVCPGLLCCYDVRVAETLVVDGAALAGEVRITVAAGGCHDTAVPCDYSGTLSAARCLPLACGVPGVLWMRLPGAAGANAPRSPPRSTSWEASGTRS